MLFFKKSNLLIIANKIGSRNTKKANFQFS